MIYLVIAVSRIVGKALPRFDSRGAAEVEIVALSLVHFWIISGIAEHRHHVSPTAAAFVLLAYILARLQTILARPPSESQVSPAAQQEMATALLPLAAFAVGILVGFRDYGARLPGLFAVAICSCSLTALYSRKLAPITLVISVIIGTSVLP